jgi:hypothetical protein
VVCYFLYFIINNKKAKSLFVSLRRRKISFLKSKKNETLYESLVYKMLSVY